MKATLLIIFTLTLIRCAIKPQYEFGLDQSVHWAQTPYHPLQDGSAVPRSYETTIRFAKPFRLTPVVILAPIKYDAANGTPIGFDIRVKDVNKAGFTIAYSALSQQSIFGFDISWGAISDPNIYTYEYETSKESDLGDLYTNTGAKAVSNLQYEFPEHWSLKSVPNIAIFMTGFQLKNCKYGYMSYEVPKNYITKTNFVVSMTVRKEGQLSFVRWNAIIGIPESLYTGTFEISWKSSNPLFSISPPSERTESLTHTIVDEGFLKFPRFPLYGLNGFYYNTQTYLRLFGKNFLLSQDKLTVDLGTWQDTMLAKLSADFFIYVPRPDLIEEIKECAVVYEECNYKGDSFVVCDKKLSFPKDGWNKPVKSFKVPTDRVLKLYELENLDGRSLRIEKDTPCMEEIYLSMVQMIDNYQINN